MLVNIKTDFDLIRFDLITLISSNYPCHEHNFMVPKVLEPLKSYCMTAYSFTIILCIWNLTLDFDLDLVDQEEETNHKSIKKL